jgi:tetratricopeptide (TPR) repeat protein
MSMKAEHLSAEDFERLLESDDEVRNRLLLHHLAVCPVCYAVAGRILDLFLAGEVGIELCTIDIDLAESRREAPALFAELASRPVEMQLAAIRADPRFRSWGLAELLCAHSEREAPGNPTRARDLARVAVEVSASLEEWQPAEQHWLDELRAYALAHLGNALRVMGKLREAKKAFLAADRRWQPAEADVGDALGYEARYLALHASFRRAERRLPEALDLLEQALAANPDPPLKARILINQAKTLEELGRIDEAIDLLGAVAREAGAEPDERLRLCIAQNRLDYLSKAERFAEAAALTSDVEPLVAAFGSEVDFLRFQWTQARIDLGSERTVDALLAFETVREGFARLDLPFDVVLISLEHALTLLALGRSEEAARLIAETLPLLASLQVEREGLVAIRLLTEAAAERRLARELIQNVLDHLRRAGNPQTASELAPG